LRQVQGRAQDAREAYRCALAIIDRVVAALTDASLRQTFLTSPHVQHIRRLAAPSPEATLLELKWYGDAKRNVQIADTP
jgi:hypothetical protein